MCVFFRWLLGVRISCFFGIHDYVDDDDDGGNKASCVQIALNFPLVHCFLLAVATFCHNFAIMTNSRWTIRHSGCTLFCIQIVTIRKHSTQACTDCLGKTAWNMAVVALLNLGASCVRVHVRLRLVYNSLIFCTRLNLHACTKRELPNIHVVHHGFLPFYRQQYRNGRTDEKEVGTR